MYTLVLNVLLTNSFIIRINGILIWKISCRRKVKKKKQQQKDSHFVAFYLGIFLEGSSISSLFLRSDDWLTVLSLECSSFTASYQFWNEWGISHFKVTSGSLWTLANTSAPNCRCFQSYCSCLHRKGNSTERVKQFVHTCDESVEQWILFQIIFSDSYCVRFLTFLFLMNWRNKHS